MVASHPWDVLGALQVRRRLCPLLCAAAGSCVRRASDIDAPLPAATLAPPQAGLQAAYVQRQGCEPYPPCLPRQPQLVVGSFEALAVALDPPPAAG